MKWYLFSCFVMMMLVVGFSVFDNVASSLIFGIGVGSVFGVLFATKKADKKA